MAVQNEDSSLPVIPLRAVDGHKGTFGTVCVVGGRADEQRIMVGGPALAALGALRSGCGLAVLAVPTSIMAAALVISPSATGIALPVDEDGAIRPSDAAQLLDRHADEFDAMVVGPGLGAGVAAQQVVIRLVSQERLPLVIDADAINALASMAEFHRDWRAPAVVTPHPGEFKRIAQRLGVSGDPTNEAARPEAAAELARRLGCVVVLKGRHTVISDGQQTHVNQTGNAALATGGTGDVLSGMIAGLAAQFARPKGSAGGTSLSLLHCARLAVWVHGLAADAWAARCGDAGMLASDLLAEIPQVMHRCRTDRAATLG